MCGAAFCWYGKSAVCERDLIYGELINLTDGPRANKPINLILRSEIWCDHKMRTVTSDVSILVVDR